MATYEPGGARRHDVCPLAGWYAPSAQVVCAVAAGPPADEPEDSQNGNDELLATAATVGVVAVGALVFEAALLPGMVLGVCAMLAPKALPRLGGALNPLFKSTVRGAYRLSEKAREGARKAGEAARAGRDVIGAIKDVYDEATSGEPV